MIRLKSKNVSDSFTQQYMHNMRNVFKILTSQYIQKQFLSLNPGRRRMRQRNRLPIYSANVGYPVKCLFNRITNALHAVPLMQKVQKEKHFKVGGLVDISTAPRAYSWRQTVYLLAYNYNQDDLRLLFDR